jgi:hypothetical protein
MLILLESVRGLGDDNLAKTIIIELTLYPVSGILVFIRNKTSEWEI